jgi:hypothetical protein
LIELADVLMGQRLREEIDGTPIDRRPRTTLRRQPETKGVCDADYYRRRIGGVTTALRAAVSNINVYPVAFTGCVLSSR